MVLVNYYLRSIMLMFDLMWMGGKNCVCEPKCSLFDTIAKEYFKDVLRKLVKLGVKGFRLTNAKHYIIDPSIPDEKTISDKKPESTHKDYDFWTHTATTYQPGLNKLLHEFWEVVQNETAGTGFLSVTDYVERPEEFQIGNSFGFDLPIVANLTSFLVQNSSETAQNIHKRLMGINKDFWPQWTELASNVEKINSPANNIFIFLLPGVPVMSYNDITTANNSTLELIEKLEEIRKNPSYQHGDFLVFTPENTPVIAYSRLKSGSPGYFVVYNPTNASVTADFSKVKGLPEQLSVSLTSEKLGENVNKVPSNAIQLQAKSAVVFTYAPKA